MSRTFRVGTRGSALALAQSNLVIEALEALHPDARFAVTVIRTEGDRIKDIDQLRKAGKGVFVKELERALLGRKIDLAIHSLKDLPSELPKGLVVGAYLQREEAADAFVGRGMSGITKLPGGAVIGTSSLRRQAFLRAAMPHLDFEELRGNLDTRLEKLRQKRMVYSGIIVAAAGLRRLYADKIPDHELLDKNVIVPAAGQGTLAIELREGDRTIRGIVESVNHRPTAIASTAERMLQQRMEGGCQIPLGIYAEAGGDGLVRITAALASLDGRRMIREQATGSADDIEGVVTAIETLMRNKGAAEILESVAPRAKKKAGPAKKRKPARRRKR